MGHQTVPNLPHIGFDGFDGSRINGTNGIAVAAPGPKGTRLIWERVPKFTNIRP